MSENKKSVFRSLPLLLTRGENLSAVKIFFIFVFSAFIDIIGVASIMPFMAILGNPSIVDNNKIMVSIMNEFKLDGVNEVMLFIGGGVFSLLIFSLMFKSYATVKQFQFANKIESSLSIRIFDSYINQNYPWFLSRSGVDLGRVVLDEVRQVVHAVILPLLDLAAYGAIIIASLILLMIVEPVISSLLLIGLSVIYFSIFLILKDKIREIGVGRTVENECRFKVVNEAFLAIKEIKINGLESVYSKRLKISAENLSKYQTLSNVFSRVPRFSLEAVAFGGGLVIILYLIYGGRDLGEILPLLAVYALVGYRLLPAINQVYYNAAQIKYAVPAIEMVAKDIHLMNYKLQPRVGSINFREEIKLDSIVFKYENSNINILNNIHLSIPFGSVVGFIGRTGSGKSTLLDVIIGLQAPTSGGIFIDNFCLSEESKPDWMGCIGYVPQKVYISDATVMENIAFGVHPDDIDLSRVIDSAKKACIHDFIFEDLEQGYEAKVGDAGGRLSGGQIQRIGLARALYKNPKLLILDESTNSVDNITQALMLESIERMRGKLTIIMVAHRVESLLNCDHIYILNNGDLTDCGGFDKIKNDNFYFDVRS